MPYFKNIPNLNTLPSSLGNFRFLYAIFGQSALKTFATLILQGISYCTTSANLCLFACVNGAVKKCGKQKEKTQLVGQKSKNKKCCARGKLRKHGRVVLPD